MALRESRSRNIRSVFSQLLSDSYNWSSASPTLTSIGVTMNHGAIIYDNRTKRKIDYLVSIVCLNWLPPPTITSDFTDKSYSSNALRVYLLSAFLSWTVDDLFFSVVLNQWIRSLLPVFPVTVDWSTSLELHPIYAGLLTCKVLLI